jgi:dynein light chain 4
MIDDAPKNQRPATPAATRTQMIKDQMDKKFGAPWHVVVGQGFGYEITYEVRNILYIYVGGRTAVLLWKM